MTFRGHIVGPVRDVIPSQSRYWTYSTGRQSDSAVRFDRDEHIAGYILQASRLVVSMRFLWKLEVKTQGRPSRRRAEMNSLSTCWNERYIGLRYSDWLISFRIFDYFFTCLWVGYAEERRSEITKNRCSLIYGQLYLSKGATLQLKVVVTWAGDMGHSSKPAGWRF